MEREEWPVGDKRIGNQEIADLDSFMRSISGMFATLFGTSVDKGGRREQPTQDPSIFADVASWDEYWLKPQTLVARLYGAAAVLYRNFLFKPTLSRTAAEHFPPGSRVIHGGSGGGEIDTPLHDELSVVALDISSVALRLYRRVHDDSSYGVLRGSIFATPLKDGAVDGVFNSGVMEHFTEAQIHQILVEFQRILTPEGKLIMFWPPTFGLSVNGLRIAHFVLNKILRSNIKLHPDEITRIRSKSHAEGILEKAGFTMIEYRFGPRDFFTNSRIVASKSGVRGAQ